MTDDIQIVPIEDAPRRCTIEKEYYALDSRNTVNRLLRNYLENVRITPTELFHSFRELRRLRDKDNLMLSAIDRVATLQAREAGEGAIQRRGEIQQSVDCMLVRARNADAMALPKLSGSLAEILDRVKVLPGKEEPSFLTLVVLSRELIPLRNWMAKLDRLVQMAAQESDPDALALLDGVIADVLGASVIQDILGWQPGLGQAIRRMLDLADGRLPPDRGDPCPTVDLLNRLLAERRLPTSRLCLIDRAHRHLRSANPLYRSDSTRELAEFQRVLDRMVGVTELYSGAITAEALTLRHARLVEQGGAAGRRAAIAGVVRLMPDRAMTTIYLCELAKTSLFPEHGEDMAQQFELLFSAADMKGLSSNTLNAVDRMARATAAHRALAESNFPENLKAKGCDLIDRLLEKFVVEERVIEKLTPDSSTLAMRSIHLIQFCAAGYLPEGRALTRARRRVMELLKQPNFEVHLVKGMDSTDAEGFLRDFHDLLGKAGLIEA